MDAIKELTGLLASNLKEALIAVQFAAIVWLYKDGRTRETAHLSTAMMIAPLASKIVECVGILERVTSALLARRDSTKGPEA
jgi:hypothetical protein